MKIKREAEKEHVPGSSRKLQRWSQVVARSPMQRRLEFRGTKFFEYLKIKKSKYKETRYAGGERGEGRGERGEGRGERGEGRGKRGEGRVLSARCFRAQT